MKTGWREILYKIGLLGAGLFFICFVTGCGRISIGTGIDSETSEEDTTEEIAGLPEGIWSPYEENETQSNFAEEQDYVATVGDNTVVRVMPDESAESYAVLNAGVTLKRTGYSKEWTRVKMNSGSYYVKSSEVQLTEVEWASEVESSWVSHVIYIDPAKQIAPDSSLEALYPDADVPEQTYDENGNVISSVERTATSKEKMGDSSQGVNSGTYEYEITMNAAYKIEEELTNRGYTVILSRSANNVNISNQTRALAAAEKGADLYIRISAGSSSNYLQQGLLGMITTAANDATKDLYQQNYTLCSSLLTKMSEATGAVNNGIYQTDDLTSLNFCSMPAVAINLGFLSNEEDDASLNDADYLESIAKGIADGVDLYYEEAE